MKPYKESQMKKKLKQVLFLVTTRLGGTSGVPQGLEE